MSNNKQSMKLYTEFEVRKAIELARDKHQEGKPYLERDEYDYSVEEVIKQLTPIELPSDEEIEQEANKTRLNAVYLGIKIGAYYVINKIKGVNK